MTASIRFNGTPTPLQVTAGTPVTLTNADDAGVAGWDWTLLYRPAASTATISNALTSSATITPDVPGTYLIRLRTWANASRTILDAVDTGATFIRFVTTPTWRIPAVQETTQVDSDEGWGNELNAILEYIQANIGGGGGGTLGGDVDGPALTNTVIALQGFGLDLSGLVAGQVLQYDGTDIVPATPSQGFEISGPTNTAVSITGSEQLIGGFYLDPGINTAGALTLQVIRIDGGGSPGVDFRLYDMGTPGTPTAGALVTTASIASGGTYGVNQIASQAFTVVASITGANQILDTPRMYELRAIVTGSIGDSVLVVSSSIKLN